VDMKPRQELRLHQQLVMTPRLQMALKILQVSTLELEQFLKQELDQNPLLEREEEEEAEAEKETGEREQTQETPSGSTEGPAKAAEEPAPPAKTETTEQEAKPSEDLDWDDYLDDVYSHAYGQNLERDDDERYERVPVAITTFGDALKHQLHMECSDDALVGVAEYIIDELDGSGFLYDDLETIAATLKVDVAIVEKALAVVQSLDPPGIAARDLRECLLLQLRRKGLGDSVAARLVSECFDELAAKKTDQARRKLGVSLDDLRAAIVEIRRLDLKPRTDPAQDDAGYITPDLLVEEVDGRYAVMLNDQDVPRVRISPTYRVMLSTNASADEREFINKKLKAARWIVQSVENRRRTMVKVMESILRAQRGFFDKGESAMKPLTLQQVADDVGMHESTVSRVTRGKYVQTPRGTFELKYFFWSGVPTSDGQEVASEAVRSAIRDIIRKEDKRRPLSDQKIADELRRMGFHISRRAVAKYRDQMRLGRAGFRKEI
jgi:RNA polymerase sigma-54 factor